MTGSREATQLRAVRVALISCLAWLLVQGCSEPDRIVTQSTGDGGFDLLLQAEKNWVRPGESLPVQVAIRSLFGPLQEGLDGELVIFASNGTVEGRFERDSIGVVVPPTLIISLPAADDSLTTGPVTAFNTSTRRSVSRAGSRPAAI